MLCPKCKSKTAVIDSRPSNGRIRRRRECKKQGHRFTTWETTSSKFVEEEDARMVAKLLKLNNDISKAFGAFLK